MLDFYHIVQLGKLSSRACRPPRRFMADTYEELMLSFKRFTVKGFWVDKGERT